MDLKSSRELIHTIIAPTLLLFFVSQHLVGQSTHAQELAIQKRVIVNETPQIQKESWDYKKTAVIVCDMWDAHHCLNAVRRVNEMTQRMNQLLIKMRNNGSIIIHAPSSCMDHYRKHPARLRALSVSPSKRNDELVCRGADER